MKKIKVPIAAPKMGKKEIEYVMDALKSGWISSQGSYVKKFEDEFSKYCGAKYGVATSSGTTSLHLALATLGITRSEEVIIPSFTMIATANAVTYTGASNVLVDSEPNHWNIDTTKIGEKITKKTKAIIAVHTYGHPVDMKPILDLARDHDLFVIEDAAEAHGAEYNGKIVGGIGDIGCFSFYANKIITTGEGGMLITNNEQLAEKAKILRAHAFSNDMHFWHRQIGFNYRMSNLQAAVGVAQMEKINEYVEVKRKNAKLYNSLLRDVRGLSLPPEAKWAKNVYWMYSVLVEDDFGISRDELMKRLENDAVETRTFFYPIHIQPIYTKRYSNERFPVADELSRKGINLPSGNNLTEAEIKYVTELIHSYYRSE